MEDSAITAALVGCILACVKLVEKTMAGKNGGTVDHRLSSHENDIGELNTKLSDFTRAFFEHKQATVIRWAREDALSEREQNE